MANEIIVAYRNSTVRNWDASDVQQFQTDLIRGGVANESGDFTDCKVIENGTPDNTVLVEVGRLYITGVDNGLELPHTERFHIKTQRQLTVPSNSTGDIRVDAVIARIDVDVEPDAQADNVGTVQLITGDGNTALDDADIQTAIGDDAFYRLANINTPDSFTTIENSDIEDTREEVSFDRAGFIVSENARIRGVKTSDGEFMQLFQMNDDGVEDYIEFMGAMPRVVTGLNPTQDESLVHKEYVDDQIASVSLAYYFGTGADGDISMDGTQGTVGGKFTKVDSNTYRLDADCHFENLTITTGKTLNPNGYRLFVNDTLDLQGTAKISSNGGNGGNASGNGDSGTVGTAGAAAHSAGTLPASLAGVAGGLGANGRGPGTADGLGGSSSSGNSETQGIGLAGVGGGAGGQGGNANSSIGGSGGGSSGGSVTISTEKIMFNNLIQLLSWPTARTFAGHGGNGGGGGGGGGATACGSNCNGTGRGGAGGGSGGNGGNFDIYVRTLTGSGTIEANGGTGGNGSDSNNPASSHPQGGGGGGGGAGAGGNGGTIILVFKEKVSWTGTIQALAGSGGTGGTAIQGAMNNIGQNGASATAARAGIIFQFQVQ